MPTAGSARSTPSELAETHVAKFRAIVHASKYVWADVWRSFSAYAKRENLYSTFPNHPLFAPNASEASCRLFWTQLYKSEVGSSSSSDSDSDSDDDDDGDDDDDTVSDSLARQQQAERARAKAVAEFNARKLAAQLAREEAERRARVEADVAAAAAEAREQKVAQARAAQLAREEARRQAERDALLRKQEEAKALRAAEQARLAAKLEAERQAKEQAENAKRSLEAAIDSATVEADMTSSNLLYQFNYSFEEHRLAMAEAQATIFEQLNEGLDHALSRDTQPALATRKLESPRASEEERRRQIDETVRARLRRNELFPSRAVHEEVDRRLEARRSTYDAMMLFFPQRSRGADCLCACCCVLGAGCRRQNGDTLETDALPSEANVDSTTSEGAVAEEPESLQDVIHYLAMAAKQKAAKTKVKTHRICAISSLQAPEPPRFCLNATCILG